MQYRVIIHATTLNSYDVLISKMMKVANIEEWSFINSRFYRVEWSEDYTYLLFGNVVKWINNPKHTSNIIQFPDIELLAEEGSNKWKEETLVKLQKLAQAIPSQHSIEEVINKLTENKILDLFNNNLDPVLFKDDTTTICVYFDPNNKKPADISISFQELLAIRLAINIFNLNTVTLVK